jgi:hypothetical protein
MSAPNKRLQKVLDHHNDKPNLPGIGKIGSTRNKRSSLFNDKSILTNIPDNLLSDAYKKGYSQTDIISLLKSGFKEKDIEKLNKIKGGRNSRRKKRLRKSIRK